MKIKTKYEGITDFMRAAVDSDLSRLMQMLCSTPNVAEELLRKDGKGRTALDWARISRNYLAITLILKVVSKYIHDSRVEHLSSVQDFEKCLIETNRKQSRKLLVALKERDVTSCLEILTTNQLVREEIEALGEIFFVDRAGALGYTPLMLAAGLNMADVVRILADAKAPINQANRFGHTALTIATCAGNADVTEYLLFKGADLYHSTTEKRTALHYACLYKKAKIVKIFFDYLLERFSVFRVEGHPLIDFDPSRWTIYVDMLKNLCNLKDVTGRTAKELLGEDYPDGKMIERRLRLSGGRGISKLEDIHKDAEDYESTVTNFSGGPVTQPLAEEGHGEAAEHQDNEDDDFVEDPHEEDEESDTISEVTLQTSAKLELKSIADPLNFDTYINHDLNEDNISSKVENKGDVDVVSASSNQWSHDTDNLHAANLWEMYSVKTALPHEEEVKCILSCFDMVHERIGLWLDRAGKEQDLIQLVPCVLNCGKMITRERMQEHIRDECDLRTVQCFQCHRIIVQKLLEEHMRKDCLRRTVACPNAYQGCGAFLTPEEVEFHLKLQCNFRLVLCKQYCQVSVPYKYYDLHEKEHCRNRIIMCDQCQSPMVAHEYSNHLTTVCPMRKVKCSVGCGEWFCLKDIKRHEEEVCQRLCRHAGCTIRLGPPAKLTYHETTECDYRPASCRYLNCGCEQFDIMYKYKVYHESFLCSVRPVMCSLGCGNSTKACKMDFHRRYECSERRVRCPSNYVGWKITLPSKRQSTKSLVREGTVLKYCRQNNRDELYIRFEDGHEWIHALDPGLVFLSTVDTNGGNSSKGKGHVDGHFSCGWLVYKNLEAHLLYNCPQRLVKLTLEDQTLELASLTTVQKAPNNALSLEKLELDVAGFRANNDVLTCSHCGLICSKAAFNAHENEDCQEVTLFCPIGCGARVKRKDINAHVETECGKRVVVCPQCHADDLWAEELPTHLKDQCQSRVIICRNFCGVADLMAKDEINHLMRSCPMRLLQCECGLMVAAKDIDSHKLFHCNERIISCPQGCGIKITFNQRDNHINFSCSQRYLFRFAQRVECPNGCGESMLRRELLEHVTYQCNKRVVECPQLCGNNVQLDRLPTHLTICPKRTICCEPGVTMCAKPLHEWFYKGVEIVNTGNGLMAWSKAVLGEKSLIEEEASETKASLLESHTTSVILDNDTSKRKTTVVESMNSLKAPALFSGSNIHISLTDNTTSTFLDKLRVAHSTSAGDDDNGSTNSSSSIYYDGIAMKFRENIRMLTCEKHNINAFMAAIRYDDEALAEYIIKQVQESADIDQENIYGDTALTLACRTGKLRFVELLVQHGADLNKETFNGRTALIEAVKSPLENVSMIEYLLKEGCMVSYKTARHGRTALDWARRYNTSEIQAYEERRRNQLKRLEKRGSNQTMMEDNPEGREEEVLLMELTEEQKRLMGRPRTVRVLELAHLVQQQCNLMFQKIATGDTDYIIGIIKDGDFFDVRNEEKAYAAMDKHLLLAQQADQDIVAVQQKMYGLSDKIDLAQAKYKDCLKALQEAEERLESTHHIEVAADVSINKYFTIYEKAATKLSTVDIEEINRVHEPTSLLLTSLYTFGLVFDLFDVESEENGPNQSFKRTNSSTIGMQNSYRIGNQSLTYDQIQSSRGQWLPVVKRQMLKSIDTLRLIQTFSRAKLHVERHQKLFARIKQLLDVFCLLVDGERRNFPMSFEDSFLGEWPLSGSGSIDASRSSSPKDRKRLINMEEQPSRPLSALDFQSIDQRESVATPFSFAGGKEEDRGASAPLPEEYILEAHISRGEEEGAIADYEWDSDAEDPDGGGYWSKGEWVSVSRKRNNWWDRQTSTSNPPSLRETRLEMSKQQNSKLVVITQDLIQQEKEKTLKAMQKDSSRSKLLSASKEGLIMEEDLVNNTINPIISQPLNASLNIEELKDGSTSRGGNRLDYKRDGQSGGGSSRNGSPRSRKAKQRRGRRHQSSKDSKRKNRQLDDREGRTYDRLQISLEEEDESVGSIFTDIMLHLLRAIHVYSSDFEMLIDKKQKTLQAAAQVDELKQQLQEALDRYNKEFTYRANLEKAYIKGLKNSKFHRDKVALHTNKVRICRLLNYVCVNGHTAVSYAASYGNYTLVEEMLSRGATVGYTADVLLQVIRFLQLSWRIYRLTIQAREHLKQTNAKGKNLRVSAAEMQNLVDEAVATGDKAEEEENKILRQHNTKTNSDLLQLFTSSRAHYLNFIRQIEELKEERKKILTLMIFNRQKIRLPIPEALYAGNWEIVQRIYERKLWHMYFTSTFTFPLPRFPFLRQSEYQYSHEKISIQDVMTHGLNYLSSGAYSSQEGWLPPGHEREPYGEMLKEINRILSETNERNMKTIKAKQRLRLIITSKKNMEKYEKKLLQLIYSRSFKEAMELVIARGINVDLETADGQTLLIAAAEENVNAVNHMRILNDELKPVLIVEYLLDRFTYRPNINYESKIGLTALIRACILGREDVVVALLNRGAAINYLNKFHKSALHYATLYGHGHIVKLLLERLVDAQVKDGDGKTAYNLAEELNFIDIMTLLSQYASGNYGTLCYTRGDINNFVSCPLGCGLRLLNYMRAQHTSDECECRFVNCPNGCGANNIMHKELGRHLSSECPRRMIQCDLCSEMVIQEDLPAHKVESCPSRLTHCPNNGCGKEMPFQDLELHLRICSYKLIPCPLMCNSYIQEIVRDDHVKNQCVNRRVPCPQKCRNMIIFKFLTEHMTNVCPRRVLVCPLCATSLEKQELERHINSACVQRDIPCPNNCGQMIRCTEINRHLQEECCRRVITCPLHCQLDIEARFLPKHMDKDCANRMVSCKYRCVDRDDLPEEKQVVNTFSAKIVNFHERYDCPNRLVTCFLCKKSDVVYKKKLNHELYHCPKRVVPCPHGEQGCGRLLPRDEVANHLATECKFRDVLCPLGCGRYLPYHEKLSHVENSCEQRYIACPLQCGEQIKVIGVMAHITEDCARRHFTKLCYGADATRKPNQKSKKKLLISPSSSSLLTEEAPKDVNSLLSSLSVVDLQAERPTNKKAMLRREETMRVMHIRKEMRFNSDLRSKLIDAIQSSSGAQMTEQPLSTQTK